MKLFRKITGLLMAAVIAVSALPFTASAEITLPDNEAVKFVDSLGAIWNLGNCFDAVNGGNIDEMKYETFWCGAKVTKELIKAVKDKGFDTIRIPASWSVHVEKITISAKSGLTVLKKWLTGLLMRDFM